MYSWSKYIRFLQEKFYVLLESRLLLVLKCIVHSSKSKYLTIKAFEKWMTRLLVNVVKGEREGKNDLTRHFFTTNVKLRRLMRVRISHEMASRKMLKFSSLALNQIFDEFFFRRRREFLQI